MAIYGIQSNPKPNQVTNQNIEGLPLDVFKGSLSVSMSFEGHPSGSLLIESISEEEIDLYRAVYGRLGAKLTLFNNLYFEIATYAETEDLIYVSLDNQIRTYNISVNLRGGNEIRANTPVEVRSSGRTQAGFGPNLVVSNKLNAARVANTVGLSYSGYSYSKDVPADSGSFKVAFGSLIQENLRLNLQILDWNDKTIRTKNYRTGGRFDVTSHDINYSVEISKQVDSEYLNTTLSGKDGLPFVSNQNAQEQALNELLGDKQKRKKPILLTTEEGDVDPTRPPYDVRKLRGIDMNFDFSGPRKTLKRTTTQNGQPFEEELFTYGFFYLAQDIRNLAAEDETQDISIPALKSDEPEEWWGLIEYQKTQYLYEFAQVGATVLGRDEVGNTYETKYLGSRLFDSKYLTTITTTGWKLSRFQQEQFDEFGTDQNALDSRWLTDEIAFLDALPTTTAEDELELKYLRAQLKTIQFNRIPYKSTTQYRLVPATEIYEDAEQTPFQTQLVDRDDIAGLGAGAGQVLVAIPDPTYVYPMKIEEERTLTQSFAQTDHPQNIIIRSERQDVLSDGTLSGAEKQEALKDLKLLPSLTTGEDTFKSVLRKIIPSRNTKGSAGKNNKKLTDLYLEFESNASHNDHNFQYSLQEKTFRTITGQLPDATVFNYEYESVDDNNSEDEADEYEYRISSTNRTDVPLSADSLSYETTSLSKAIAAARCELELENFLSSTDINMNLAWFYPAIRPGDYLNIIDDGSKRNVRVKNCSFQIDYQGYVNGELLKTCSGTNLTCGIMPTKGIQSKRVRKDSSDDEGDLTIRTTIYGERMFGLSIVPNIQTRRNPSGDAVEEASGSRL
jgi:hypothetical protein